MGVDECSVEQSYSNMVPDPNFQDVTAAPDSQNANEITDPNSPEDVATGPGIAVNATDPDNLLVNSDIVTKEDGPVPDSTENDTPPQDSEIESDLTSKENGSVPGSIENNAPPQDSENDTPPQGLVNNNSGSSCTRSFLFVLLVALAAFS